MIFPNYFNFTILSSCHDYHRSITKLFLNSSHFYLLFTYYLLHYYFIITLLFISPDVFVQLSAASVSRLCFLRWESFNITIDFNYNNNYINSLNYHILMTLNHQTYGVWRMVRGKCWISLKGSPWTLKLWIPVPLW